MTARPVRGLLLDFGGVVWDMRWDVAHALEAAHGLPCNALVDTLYRTPTWAALERGRGDRAAWLEEAHRLLEARAGRPLPRLHETWRAAQALVPATLTLVQALRPAYRIGLLSNADRSLRERLRDGLGILGCFDVVVCSAEVGVAKPEPAIYRVAARRLGLAPPECLFVDDSVANVAAARALGMRAVHFRLDRGDDLAALLAAHGVRPPGEAC